MLEQHTDIHINSVAPSASLVYPGPAHLPEGGLEEVRQMLARCEASALDDFTIVFGDATWRGRRDRQTVDGIWYRLRQMPRVAPRLDTLPSPLPTTLEQMLLSPSLVGGGLVYVCGAAGSGKTTTASASVVSRLHRFGGVAYTIEDPPEMPLNGWHGQGYCSQTCVAGEGALDWAESFRCALRSQPAATHQMLFVGEVRNAESAQAMLRAAANGFLVISTGFGTDIVSALDALVRLSGDSANSLSALLRLILHQRIRDDRLQVSVLASPGSSSPVAARIRTGQLVHLASDLEYQSIQMARGINPLESPGVSPC